MFNGGPEYDIAAAIAAQISNLLGEDYPGGRAELFGRLLFLVLDGFDQVKELSTSRYEPSEN